MSDDTRTAAEETAAAMSCGCGGSCGCSSAQEPVTDEQWKAKLIEVIDRVRPFLQMDGGDMELLAVEDKNAIVRLVGACHGCPSAAAHMKFGVEEAIKRELPDFGELITVEL
jgi:Fe-S cluster biogenesis protein NfuA